MSSFTRMIARLVFLPTLVFSIALLAKSYAGPGDGFAAGVTASIGFLLQALAFGREELERLFPLRWTLPVAVVGLLLMLAVALYPLLLSEPLLTHYPRAGAGVRSIGTIELHTAVLFDIGIFLLVLGFGVGGLTRFARAAERGRT